MSAALAGVLGAAVVTAIASIIVAIISRAGARNAATATKEAAEAAKDAAMVKNAFDGLNQTIDTLVEDQIRLRGEVAHLRNKCAILGENEGKMRAYIRRHASDQEYQALELKVVPNGY